jgi:hypothetical protein
MAEPPKLRSIDFLSAEQLRRKRETDRNSARLAREQTKAYIQNLEARVYQLEHQNYDLEKRLAGCVCHIATNLPCSKILQGEVEKGLETQVEDKVWQRDNNLQSQDVTSIGNGDWTSQVFDGDMLQMFGLNHFGARNFNSAKGSSPR